MDKKRVEETFLKGKVIYEQPKLEKRGNLKEITAGTPGSESGDPP